MGTGDGRRRGHATVGEGGTHWQREKPGGQRQKNADYDGARIAFRRDWGKKRVG